MVYSVTKLPVNGPRNSASVSNCRNCRRQENLLGCPARWPAPVVGGKRVKLATVFLRAIGRSAAVIACPGVRRFCGDAAAGRCSAAGAYARNQTRTKTRSQNPKRNPKPRFRSTLEAPVEPPAEPHCRANCGTNARAGSVQPLSPTCTRLPAGCAAVWKLAGLLRRGKTAAACLWWSARPTAVPGVPSRRVLSHLTAKRRAMTARTRAWRAAQPMLTGYASPADQPAAQTPRLRSRCPSRRREAFAGEPERSSYKARPTRHEKGGMM